MLKRLEIRSFGVVQGISYRWFIRGQARLLNLKGTVKNLEDGSVEIIAEGENNSLIEFTNIAKNGYLYAKVERTETNWGTPTNSFTNFCIIY